MDVSVETESDAEARSQFLTLSSGIDEYAVEVLRVREILSFATSTSLPDAPPSIRGLINLRGRPIVVMDLATRLGGAPSVASKRSCVILVEVEWNDEMVLLGLLADAVSQVVDLTSADLEPPPALVSDSTGDCVKALARVGEEFVPVLDLERLFDADSLRAASLDRGRAVVVADATAPLDSSRGEADAHGS